MTRGNQRELAREKSAKKNQSQKKGTVLTNVTLAQKKLNDADLMRQKQAESAKDKQANK